MTRTAIVGLTVVSAAALLLVAIIGLPWPAPAQQPAPEPASLPAGYVGAETCKGCHEEAFAKFETTRMGRLFLRRPRNTAERLACENSPVSGTAAQNDTATVQKWPAFEDTLVHLETSLIYYFGKNWAARLGYAFEMFDQSDWRTNLNPFLPGVSSIWLGNTVRDYTAHMMGVSLSYRFK